MEAKEYEVLDFKKGDFQDAHGNYWCDMALKDEGEPVRIVVKDPMQYRTGMTLYGRITDETSKAGKSYRRFRREQRPDDDNQPAHLPKQPWQPRDDNRIAAQWALGRSYEKFGASPEAIKDAQWLFNNIEAVIGADAPLVASPAPTSGYEKFKSSKPKTEDEKDAEAESLYATALMGDQPMSVDDIPF